MSQLFSRSKVPQLEKLISHHVERFIDKIRNSNPIIDIGVASRALEADIMCKILIGFFYSVYLWHFINLQHS